MMAPKLAIILFVEFERASVVSILDLLEKQGGTPLWSEGTRFIFQFRSPTAAIVASESLLRFVPQLDGEDQVRCYIDTCEVSLDLSQPAGPALGPG